MRAAKNSKVLDILKEYPAAAKVFHKFHLYPFRDLDSDLETLAAKDGADLEAFLRELNAAIASPAAGVEAAGVTPGRKIHQNMSFRLVTTRYPETRAVFNTYKILELAEEHWPDEKMSFFALGLHLSSDKLVDELNEALEGSDATALKGGAVPRPEDIHIGFLKVSILFALTTGCLYGAGFLFYFAMSGTLSGVPRAMLEAHGHTQVYGWVGLFIMGISYFALPRFWGTPLYNVFIAGKTLIPMTIGIVLVFVSRHLLLMGNYTPFWVMAIAGSLMELLAICLFIYLMVKTYRSNTTRKFEVYEAYFFAGYAWFLVQALIFTGTLVYMAYNGLDTIPPRVEQPMLHMQIMGFACMVILGILTKTLPIFLGIKEPKKDINLYAFLLLNASILLRVLSLLFMETYPLFKTTSLVAGFLESLAVLLFFYNLRLHRIGEIESGVPRKDFRKFIKAALFWFIVAELALLYFNLHQFYTGAAVPYALFGAYRHAIFVGFITMMILGCASKMIPMSIGVQLYSYRALFWSFVLINTGTVLRVTCQPLAADYNMTALYLPMGISGFLEWGALCLFGYNIWKTVGQKPVKETQQDAGEKITVVTPETNVYQLVKQHPKTLDVLVNRGFKQLRNPMLLNTLARTVNIGTAVSIHSTDLGSLLKELNDAVDK
ncbi:MAG: DUF1858 domain-containing protein [Candidatus Brocadiales bacterium]|nr:DUF1858 domain-containing protein [Candidatus Bathyanammoxibius amoris]